MPVVLALSALLVAAVPEGWTQIPEPTQELLDCANYSRREWRVTTEAGVVRIGTAPRGFSHTGPSLPFAIPKGIPGGGDRHVLAVSDGYLVGFDAGEWGGALYSVSSDGNAWRKVLEGNVQGLVQLGAGEALVLQGLNHMGLRRGSARWLRLGLDRRWTVSEERALDAGPQAFVATRDAVYVVTAESLTRIGRDRKVAVLQPLPTGSLYPNSMEVDPSGALWVGMRHLVLRLVPTDSDFKREWLAPKDCPRSELREYRCECVKEPAQ